ncbi:3-oxoadipate enol-lactonase [Marivita geojedonensis]|uniref:3-oxoadipate enol-lactonase n=1 Tax=Marivita geojedonensis TaxID=1123756 RepID=A0A1X4NM62_9RHOB|nr:3-oxoadipate enol-lactonase [Marivita geojedonensis]OSQ51456.1 3-oxoadipate enol-lactonase [Marivita geojedonensis]PRY77867.1 3-oxoadipate enol-lactonase [Marivita geojedonensis]
MNIADLEDIRLHYRIDGDPDGAPVVFANSLGTDMRLWDKVLARLPKTGLKYIRYDKRGHGLSECPKPPYGMGTLVRDVERLMDHLAIRDAVFVGLSIGGMIAQGLAAKRLDLVRAMVLSNTGARIATREIWAQRIADAERGGVVALADATMTRWFTPAFRATPEFTAWRNMLTRTPADGYIGCSHAIAGTDFYATTAALRLPTLGIAGSEDGSTPPDLVRETTELVPGSQFHLIRKAGHLPCVEAPDEYARVLNDFIIAQAH